MRATVTGNKFHVCGILSRGFRGCQQFFYQATPPKNLPYGISLCQTMAQTNRIVFATSYDSTNKIPIYSAYIMDIGAPCPRDRPSWREEENISSQSQASDKDYLNSRFDRGHLFPCYHANHEIRPATFTLTNAVPQNPSFNRGVWFRRGEYLARQWMMKYCRGGIPYFITGAIPNRQGYTIGNTEVNIPSIMYTAAVCAEQDGRERLSFGYYGYNQNGGNVQWVNVGELGKFVSQNYRRYVNFFKGVGEQTNKITNTILNDPSAILRGGSND